MNKLKNTWVNYKKATPEKFRKKGDWALLVGVIALLAQLVDGILVLIENEKIQVMLGGHVYAQVLTICTLFAIIYKFYTNTKTIHKEEDTPG